MLLKSNLALILLAGLMNGSYIIPAKFVNHINREKIWLFYSIIGVAIIPWIFLTLLIPQVFAQLLMLPSSELLFISIGGALFGIGQVCFVVALDRVGIALSFVINLSFSVVIGSMFMVLYRGQLFSRQGAVVTLAVFFIVSSLILYYLADKKQQLQSHTAYYHVGWCLAGVSGVASGIQNITFMLIVFNPQLHSISHNSYWMWPPFLLIASIPMMISFLWRIFQSISTSSIEIRSEISIRNISLITLMGLFFTGSLVLYSFAMNDMKHHYQVIGWPTFMVAIILTSQIWEFIFPNGNRMNIIRNKVYFSIISISLLIIAIITLAIGM